MSEETTVTVGDTTVEIRETEDGFEATATDDEPESETGLWLRFSSGSYGCEIPLDADFVVTTDRHGGLCVAWKTEDDRSDLKSKGHRAFDFDEETYDGYAAVTPERTEIVD